jgi:hypothetical protein
MPQLRDSRFNSELKALVVEASLALARLDADRLEELALSCRALNRDLSAWNAEERTEMVRQTRESAPEMAVFERVLEATRANLDVMSRLRQLHEGHRDYGGSLGSGSSGSGPWGLRGDGDGNN